MTTIVPGVTAQLGARVWRVTAPNPGVMTGPGTNSYIIGDGACAIIDPGPLSDMHCAALLRAVGPRLRWILCTHTHHDHSPGAQALKQATNAEMIGLPAPALGNQDDTFVPDRILSHGESVTGDGFSLRAIHTPGHASNHLCYLLDGERMLFSGDHIMQGSTVVINPPDGDMSAYMASLRALLAIDIAGIAPGHGHLIEHPHDEVRRLIAHRTGREQKVIAALSVDRGQTLDDLVGIVYSDTPQRLHMVARRSLHAHLMKLELEGHARADGERWHLAAGHSG
jgi:glyoxylase-like metal-dependent hydrolase (beta-lactamase superfamily II)